MERRESGAFRPPPVAPARSGPPCCGPRSFTAFWALALVPLPPLRHCLSSPSPPPPGACRAPALGSRPTAYSSLPASAARSCLWSCVQISHWPILLFFLMSGGGVELL